MDYEILFDNNFDEYAWELEAKGWVDISIRLGTMVIQMSFYDPTRLEQEVTDAIAANKMFFENNLVVVSKVCRNTIENAVKTLDEAGILASLQGTPPIRSNADL